jgi:short-subunit dehydrogenase
VAVWRALPRPRPKPTRVVGRLSFTKECDGHRNPDVSVALSCAGRGGRCVVSAKLKPLAKQVILVTGASSGIGLATAKAAAARGASVFLVARTTQALASAVGQIEAAGGRAAFAVADVGNRAAVDEAARSAIARFGRIDTWVNCAGVAIYAPLTDTPAEQHQRLIQTNYFGVVHGSLTAVKHLSERGGALITVGSIASDFPSPIMGAYSASKHAAKAFIESLRIELGASGSQISVTLIKPSGTNTPIAEHAANHVGGEALIPPPVYDPSLVAEAVLDAAEHRRRDVTVGGMGRLQVLLATHFPALYARLGGAVAALLADPKKPKTESDNLDSAFAEGRERSRDESGRRFSLYSPVSRHPSLGAAAISAAVGLLIVTAYSVRKRDIRTGRTR